ncbi:hypothetical protein BDP27DRAFT_1312969 [Rhodocollybia butyracea]|uniref:Uncharacterized protein n=1 Tax=Rhodocollybia butyracea TaxID=206335 RepID=A0A9P5Q2P6_9AGAR|nr:hypothetical protein BDP27DRAFT_1312969 [Rhodocollybia butyracea]
MKCVLDLTGEKAKGHEGADLVKDQKKNLRMAENACNTGKWNTEDKGKPKSECWSGGE